MLLSALIALLLGSIIYGFIAIRKKRAELAGVPCPPQMHWLFGNIDVMAKAVALFPSDIHFQHVLLYLHQKYDMPSVWCLDLWPVANRFIIADDPAYISKYATTGQSLPKARAATAYLNTFLGKSNLVSIEGGHWKSLRSVFNPGFSAAHLMTLVPYIIDNSLVFIDVMREKARTNELFQLEEYATRLTIDIIGKVALDADFNSQKKDHPLVTTFRERTGLMPIGSRTVEFMNNLEFIRLWKLRQNEKKLDYLVGKEIDRTIGMRSQNATSATTKPASFKDRKRSIIDLALDAYYSEKMVSASGSFKPSKETDAAFRDEAISSVKTFIFAGHDTTSSTIAYTLYLLHHHPRIHARLLTELHQTFGPSLSPTTIATTLKTTPSLINSLIYTTAIIKEVLRIFPPASTLREGPTDTFTIPNPNPQSGVGAGGSTTIPCPTTTTFWPIALLVHRNKRFFPDPEAFVPERFIPELTPYPEAKLFTEEGKDAFRAFEKGPRGCIGEQLAVIESKIILAMVVGAGFDFVAEIRGRVVECAVHGEPIVKQEGEKGHRGPVSTVVDTEEWAERVKGGFKGGEVWEKGEAIGTEEEKERMRMWEGRTIEGYGIYQMLKGAAKPAYGMPGRIYVRE